MDTRPVVAGVDGGPDSLRALKWAAEYATTLDAPLIALTAYQLPAVYGPYAMAGWEGSSKISPSHGAGTRPWSSSVLYSPPPRRARVRKISP